MVEVSGRFEKFALAAILLFLGELQKSGRVHAWEDCWSGDVFLSNGQVVAAAFGEARGLGGQPSGTLHGLAALEAIVVLLGKAEFFFVEGLPRAVQTISMAPQELESHLAGLAQKHESTKLLRPSPGVIPRLIPVAEQSGYNDTLTLERTTLLLLLEIDGQRSVAELLGNRDLIRTFVDLSWLVANNLIRL